MQQTFAPGVLASSFAFFIKVRLRRRKLSFNIDDRGRVPIRRIVLIAPVPCAQTLWDDDASINETAFSMSLREGVQFGHL